MKATTYKRIVGYLMYLATVTRPDLPFVANRRTAGMSAPTSGHWERDKRIFNYLKGTCNYGTMYKSRHVIF